MCPGEEGLAVPTGGLPTDRHRTGVIFVFYIAESSGLRSSRDVVAGSQGPFRRFYDT